MADSIQRAPAPVDVAASYSRYGPMVLRRCRSILKSEAEALDALQDVFVRLIQHREQLDDRAMSSLLYRMATQVCLNKLRSKRRRPEELEDPQDARSALAWRIAAASDSDERTAARGLLSRLFASEPESSAVIAMLHLHDGLTLEEVAAEVGLSVSGVRKRLRKLEERLQTLVQAK